jgi:hypothetical protein
MNFKPSTNNPAIAFKEFLSTGVTPEIAGQCINQLMTSGQMSQEQYQQLRQKASSLL